MARTIETDWFSYEIKAHDGSVFYTLEDLKAEVEIDSDGGNAGVETIFTEDRDATGKKVRHYLAAGDLYNEIESYLDRNFDAVSGLSGGAYSSRSEHALSGRQLGVRAA